MSRLTVSLVCTPVRLNKNFKWPDYFNKAVEAAKDYTKDINWNNVV